MVAEMTFQYPWVLLGMPILGLLYGYFKKWTAQKQTYLHMPTLQAKTDLSNWKTKTYFIPELMKILAMCLAVVALARPRLPMAEETTRGEGIDIMMCLDVSSSMLMEDFVPNRLEVTKKIAVDFVDKRKNDRIGLVVFSGESFTQCPLTIDHRVLNEFIMMQDVGYLESGTAIGMGLSTAVNRLKASTGKSKIVILLTDGDNNAGAIDPRSAAILARELGIKVYTIGIGAEDEMIGMNGMYRIDVELLKDIAIQTSGKFYRAKTGEDLRDVYAEIDRLEKSTFDATVIRHYEEKYRPWLLASLLLFFVAVVLEQLVYKKFEL
jgi:Ca-activated chloride channel homolog